MAAEFENKVVMITGAAGNLGSACARRFAAGGAKLVLVGRGMDELKALADTLSADSLPVVADVGNPDEVDALVRQVDARFGRIDALAHTVGGFRSGTRVDEPGVLEQFEYLVNLNVRPLYVTCGRVTRYMLDNKIAGHIIVVGARSALRGSARTSAYTAVKAAVLRIVESLALEVRDQGIHVNAVSPSTIDTPQNRADMPNADPSKWVTVDQLADAIAFLASPQAAALYGANLEVYGRA